MQFASMPTECNLFYRHLFCTQSMKLRNVICATTYADTFLYSCNRNSRTVVEPLPAVDGETLVMAKHKVNRTWCSLGAQAIPGRMGTFDFMVVMLLTSSEWTWQFPAMLSQASKNLCYQLIFFQCCLKFDLVVSVLWIVVHFIVIKNKYTFY